MTAPRLMAPAFAPAWQAGHLPICQMAEGPNDAQIVNAVNSILTMLDVELVGAERMITRYSYHPASLNRADEVS